jgi:hypothetical protein
MWLSFSPTSLRSPWPHAERSVFIFVGQSDRLFGKVDSSDVMFFRDELDYRWSLVEDRRTSEDLPDLARMKHMAEALDVGLGVVISLEAAGRSMEAEELSEVLARHRRNLLNFLCERWLGDSRSMQSILGCLFTCGESDV